MNFTKTVLAAASAATLLTFAMPTIPASARVPGEQAQKLGSDDKRDVWERDRVRRQQIRQNAGTPMYEPFFAPLYEGRNSPAQSIKRTFN